MTTDVLERLTVDEGREAPAERAERPREGRVVAMLRAPWRGLGIALATLFVSVPLFVLAVVSVCLIPVGIGLYTTPVVFAWLRDFGDWRRSLVAGWGGLPVPAARRASWPEGAGAPRRSLVLMGDPASWRKLWWLLVDMSAGLCTALLPLAVIAHGVYGYVLAAGVWEPIHDGDGAFWYAFVRVEDQQTANLAALTGTGILLAGVLTAGVVLRGHLRLTRLVLGRA